jgi:hypothetical protein
VFVRMEHDLVHIVLALKKDPCQCRLDDMADRIDRIARKVSFNVNV